MFKSIGLATHNLHKWEEMSAFFHSHHMDLEYWEGGPEVEETGSTFEENALLKALAWIELFQKPVLADDSGLVVPALQGAPGIYSARYAGEKATSSQNNARLLRALEKIEDRKAYFQASLALVWPKHMNLTFENADQWWPTLGKSGAYAGLVVSARVYGQILTQPRGTQGFGYDPLFFYSPLSKTFAELNPSQKLKVSHRGLALKKLLDLFS